MRPLYVREKIRKGYTPIDPAVAAPPTDKKLVLATLHRRENIGEPFAQCAARAADPGPGRRQADRAARSLNPQVRAEVMSILSDAPNVRLLEPVAVHGFRAPPEPGVVVVGDSGGVEEARRSRADPDHRETTERPEVIEAGSTLVGSDHRRSSPACET